MKRSAATVTALAIAGLTFVTGCGPSGPSTQAEVCAAFDELGEQYLQGNGVFGNPLFRKAEALADVAGRFTGSPSLASESSALDKIADSGTISGFELMNATQRIADLCGHLLGLGRFSGGTGNNGLSGTGNRFGGTASTPTYSSPGSTSRTTSSARTTAPSSSSSSGAGFQQAVGPGGMEVAIPADWNFTDAPSADNRQAENPSDSRSFVRFGASAPTKASQYDEIVGGERTNPSIKSGYQRVRLTQLAFRGADAVDWEFTFSKAGLTRHARGLYWRSGGLGYVVYASGPNDKWSSLQPVFDQMVATVITH